MRPDWQICGEAEDGREVEISSSMPTIPIVMYTLYRTPELEVAAKLVGIRQVIAKEDGWKCLLSAIETELLAKNSPQ
jgi:hypothetical protein